MKRMLLVTIITYGAFAFALLELNPFNWSVLSRTGFIALIIAGNIIAYATTEIVGEGKAIAKKEKEDKC